MIVCPSKLHYHTFVPELAVGVPELFKQSELFTSVQFETLSKSENYSLHFTRDKIMFLYVRIRYFVSFSFTSNVRFFL